MPGWLCSSRALMGRLGDDPALTERARRLRDLMQSTVGDVRRVVDELRPPALDELGIVGALREQVSSYVLEGGPGVSVRPLVEVLVARELPLLPAAVEVAAYRIASEAVANVVRHAEATRCTLTLSVAEGWMLVEIRDDGVGISSSSVPHVGLFSMNERAEELGGRLTITSIGEGTSVLASLPLRADR